MYIAVENLASWHIHADEKAINLHTTMPGEKQTTWTLHHDVEGLSKDNLNTLVLALTNNLDMSKSRHINIDYKDLVQLCLKK